MDRILVVVFDTETKVYEGKNALLQLDGEGRITVYAYAVISKNADGTVTVKQGGGDGGPLGALVGTLIGSLIGLLGGAAGVAIGFTTGFLVGGTADMNREGISDDFVDDVTKQLRPNRFALLAEVEEGLTTPVDNRMEAIGGIVFRRALSEVKRTIHDEHVAAIKADLAQMKAEHAQAHADRKARLQKKIDRLDSKLQAQLIEASDRRDAAEWEAKAKAEDLERKEATLDRKTAETRV